MGNRLTKIVTRTGDDGSTGLANGTRLDKSSARINALGDVDELNSHIGVLIADTVNAEDRAFLQAVQQDLFDLGSELAVPGNSYLRTDACADLENYVAAQTTYLPSLREFILPGGSRPAALAQVCRTVARRAERSLVAVQRADGNLSAASLQFLNRLSDVFFVLARRINQHMGVADPLWRGVKK